MIFREILLKSNSVLTKRNLTHVRCIQAINNSQGPLRRSLHTGNAVLNVSAEKDTTKVSSGEEHSFQAETRMLLDIVAKSLYSEKEVFVRELVSNASDALEKARYLSVEGTGAILDTEDLRINITTDKYAKTLIIQDSGVGMTKEDLIANLGTIARSGSKAFMEELGGKSSQDVSNIIGKFGVGFYSAFMVSERVEVFTRTRAQDAVGLKWSSDGCGSYTIEECLDAEPGTKVVCHLKMEDREYCDEDTLKKVLKKYSSFIGYGIEINSEAINTIQPLWLLDPKEVTPEQHTEFYRYVGGAYDSPRYTLHYRADAPINLRTVVYFPESKPSMFDLSQSTEGSVALYCRKVLINNKAESVLPKWLRFVKGVVDSEDIPLNLSREMLQNSAIIRKVRTVLENRCIRFLSDKLIKDREGYLEFFNDYGLFIKEGVITGENQPTKEEIGRLLVFECSSKPEGEKISLAEASQTESPEIYYLAAPTRQLAEQSPYYESLKKRGVEVLFCYENYDEVVLMQLQTINGKTLISAEKDMRRDKDEAEYIVGSGLDAAEAGSLMDWWRTSLAGKCASVRATPRLEQHPCVVTVEEMAAARHFVKTQFSQIPESQRYALLCPQLEINPSHPIIMKLNVLRTSDPGLADLLANQLFSNALVTAGLVDDARSLVTNLNTLLEKVLEKH